MTKTNTLAALGAAALLLVALGNRKGGAPVAAISPQPAQRERDAGLSSWLQVVDQQGGTWNNAQAQGLPALNTMAQTSWVIQ